LVSHNGLKAKLYVVPEFNPFILANVNDVSGIKTVVAKDEDGLKVSGFMA